ncbi:glycerate kinase [Curtobacterium sp. MCPF17_052]|nr:glycerate kinase [Curtobacterium sp. MCPF17_052]WIB11679.1 glycerate kinase [Curtobacterium sp. MCPF17_052]
MRVVIAPDSFKGTASAADVARAVADGWRSERPDDDLVILPMADGGEGTIDAVATAVPGSERVPVTVTGPDDRPVETAWLRLPDGRALVELAATSGLTLLDHPRPDTAHTTGFGQAIAAALDAGATGLLLGIGGSASTDGGIGALRALGLAVGTSVPADATGGTVLDHVPPVDTTALRTLPKLGAVVLSDVTSPAPRRARGRRCVRTTEGRGARPGGRARGPAPPLVRVLPPTSTRPRRARERQAGRGSGCSPGAPSSRAVPRRSPTRSDCRTPWPEPTS